MRRHCAAHHCQPGFIRAARPRRRRPAPPSHRRRRPLSASFPNRRGPRRTGTCPRQARPSRALPADGMRHIPCLRVRCASRRCGTRRGVVPTLLAPQRRSPAARLSPGSVPRRRGTRRVRRLDSHRAPQANLVHLNDVPDRPSDVSPFPIRRRVILPSPGEDGTPHRRWHLCSKERCHFTTRPPGKRATAACSAPRPVTAAALAPAGDRALRHGSVITSNGAPALAPRALPPAVTNFGFAKVSDSGVRGERTARLPHAGNGR